MVPSQAGSLIGLEHLSHADSLGELGLFNLEKRWLWRDLAVAFQNLKGAYKEKERVFSGACCGGTKGGGVKLKKGRFGLDVREKCFTVRMVRLWHRVSREAVDAASLEVSKVRLDKAGSSLTQWKVSGIPSPDLSLPVWAGWMAQITGSAGWSWCELWLQMGLKAPALHDAFCRDLAEHKDLVKAASLTTSAHLFQSTID